MAIWFVIGLNSSNASKTIEHLFLAISVDPNRIEYHFEIVKVISKYVLHYLISVIILFALFLAGNWTNRCSQSLAILVARGNV